MRLLSISLDEINSTQDFSREIISKDFYNCYDIIVVTAKKQFEGKGQRGNRWSSEVGGLYITISLKSEEKKIKEIQNLSIKIAELVSKLLEENYKIKTKIKPPNDVYALTKDGYKKISGILIETIPIKNLRWILVGIGVNFYNKIPKDLENKATNLFEITSKKHNIRNFIKKIIKHIKEIKI